MPKVTYERPDQTDGTKTITCHDYHTDKEPLLVCIRNDQSSNLSIPLERVIEIRG